MSPKECFDLVSAIKKEIQIPIFVHTHMTTGLAAMTYLKAAEAGASGIYTVTACFSGGTSQPGDPNHGLIPWSKMGISCGTDAAALKKINDFFVPVQKKFLEDGIFDPYVLITKTDVLTYQIPAACDSIRSHSSRHKMQSIAWRRCWKKLLVYVQTWDIRRW